MEIEESSIINEMDEVDENGIYYNNKMDEMDAIKNDEKMDEMDQNGIYYNNLGLQMYNETRRAIDESLEDVQMGTLIRNELYDYLFGFAVLEPWEEREAALAETWDDHDLAELYYSDLEEWIYYIYFPEPLTLELMDFQTREVFIY